MADLTADASLASKKAQDSELVALKQQVDRLKGDLTPGVSKDKKLRKACNDFEAVFISKMWEQMRATLPKEGYLHSPQEDMYRSMFDRDFAEKLASDGGIGMGDMLYSQLKQKIGGGISANGAKSISPAKGAAAKTDLKMPKVPAATGAAQSASTTSSSAGPAIPASVSGDVMADVEALASRIEAAYDRKQATAALKAGGYGQGSTQGGTGRNLAVVG